MRAAPSLILVPVHITCTSTLSVAAAPTLRAWREQQALSKQCRSLCPAMTAPAGSTCRPGCAACARGWDAHLGRAQVEVVDGVQRVVLHVPAEGAEAGADVEPGYHHARDQLLAHQVAQHRALHTGGGGGRGRSAAQSAAAGSFIGLRDAVRMQPRCPALHSSAARSCGSRHAQPHRYLALLPS